MSQGHIILCGFMGCGKTTIGRILAKEIKREFYDLDETIEKKTNKTINQWFDIGESQFRQQEKEQLSFLLNFEFAVIALGGGTLSNIFLHSNIEMIIKQNTLIWLDIPFSTAMKRIEQGHHFQTRPMLKISKEQLKDLYHQRREMYQKAQIHIFAEHDKDQIIKKIIQTCNSLYIST